LVRRAKALQKVLEHMTIYIADLELIVGNQASKPRSAPIFPEFSYDWIENELQTLDTRQADRFDITDDQKASLKDIFSYWRGKTTKEHALALIPEEVKEAQSNLVFLLSSMSCGIGHIAPDYQRVLKYGLRSILDAANQRLQGIELSDLRRPFYQAIITAGEAAIAFAHRFQELALQLWHRTVDVGRKAELQRIAEICGHVPAYPARDFYEALQSFWFVHVIIQIESNGHSISPGRFDQYMAEFYEKGSREGRLTDDQAGELLQCLWIKFNEINKIRDRVTSQGFGGYPMFQNLVVGGENANGTDATNKLSYMCLDAAAKLRLPQPSLSVRFHRNSPKPFQLQAAELAKAGTGMPSFFNDEILVPVLTDMGCTLEDARTYAPVGCIEVQAPGKTQGYYPGGFLNLAKCLELVLHDGHDPGERLSVPPHLGTFREVLAAFRRQVAHFVPVMVTADNIIEEVQARIAPSPFLSILVDDCLDKAKSVEGGGEAAPKNRTGV